MSDGEDEAKDLGHGRAELAAVRARRDALRTQLAGVERAIGSLGPLVERRRALEEELAAAREAVDRAGRRHLPLLATVRIASPCEASWDDMDGDHRVRHCGQCDQKVYDLSAMREAEAEQLLRANGESICVRFHERADGTMLTSDCAVGAARRRRRRWLTAGAAAVLAAGAAATASLTIGAPAPAPLEPCVLELPPAAPRAVNVTILAPGEEPPPRVAPNAPPSRIRMGRISYRR